MSSLFNIQNWITAYYLALFEVRMRYARSILGPFWITLQTTIFITSIGFVFSYIFKSDIQRYIPYFSLSYIFWQFFSSTFIESSSALVRSQGYIKDRGINPIIFVIANFLKNIFYLLHNLPIVIIALVYFKFASLVGFFMALPGFVLFFAVLYLAGVLISFLASRFHDTSPLIESLMAMLFLVSPIMWEPSLVAKKPEILHFNPIYHLFEIWRGPLLDGTFPLFSYVICGGFLLVLLTLLVLIMPKYKKITLWI